MSCKDVEKQENPMSWYRHINPRVARKTSQSTVAVAFLPSYFHCLLMFMSVIQNLFPSLVRRIKTSLLILVHGGFLLWYEDIKIWSKHLFFWFFYCCAQAASLPTLPPAHHHDVLSEKGLNHLLPSFLVIKSAKSNVGQENTEWILL